MNTIEHTLVRTTVRYSRPQASGSKLYTRTWYIQADDVTDAISFAVNTLRDSSTDFELLGVDTTVCEEKLLESDD